MKTLDLVLLLLAEDKEVVIDPGFVVAEAEILALPDFVGQLLHRVELLGHLLLVLLLGFLDLEVDFEGLFGADISLELVEFIVVWGECLVLLGVFLVVELRGARVDGVDEVLVVFVFVEVQVLAIFF